jgi:hypothetical protein
MLVLATVEQTTGALPQNALIVVDLESGASRTLGTQGASVLASSPDGRWLAVGFPHFGLQVFRLADGFELLEVCHQRSITSLGFLGSSLLASCDAYGRLHVYDLAACIAAEGHQGPLLLP